MTSITPSTFQVNEGDSLTTSLSGFTPGATLFFKVGGRGVSKKDFAAGGVKGSVKVNANGVATISHTLRADKATEGDESFSIRVFSDKKMRNLLGQADSVSVLDTSVKAPKVVKPPKDGGGVSGGGKDPVTGSYYIEMTGNKGTGRVISDQVTDWYDLRKIDTFFESDVLPGEILIEFEFNKKYIISTETSKSRSTGEQYFYRSVLEGDFNFNKNRLATGTIKRNYYIGASFETNGSAASPSLTGGVEEYINGRKMDYISNLFVDRGDSSGNMIADFFLGPNQAYIYGSSSDKSFTESVGGGIFFQEGWWQDPFTPNLI